jgi:uncharacterized membrane protein
MDKDERMGLLSTAAVTVSGFTACGEFASFAFVHPVVRRLPPEHHLTVEQGLLDTFGRVMPILMPATGLLSLLHASRVERPAAWAAVACNAAALACTVAVNVPINKATATWDPAHPPQDWKQVRDRWERFQAVRSPLLLLGFFLVAGTSSGPREATRRI